MSFLSATRSRAWGPLPVLTVLAETGNSDLQSQGLVHTRAPLTTSGQVSRLGPQWVQVRGLIPVGDGLAVGYSFLPATHQSHGSVLWLTPGERWRGSTYHLTRTGGRGGDRERSARVPQPCSWDQRRGASSRKRDPSMLGQAPPGGSLQLGLLPGPRGWSMTVALSLPAPVLTLQSQWLPHCSLCNAGTEGPWNSRAWLELLWPRGWM